MPGCSGFVVCRRRHEASLQIARSQYSLPRFLRGGAALRTTHATRIQFSSRVVQASANGGKRIFSHHKEHLDHSKDSYLYQELFYACPGQPGHVHT